ncbi:MAG TPA: alpha/beta hydrolase, partial [Mycobacteriales bacterium]|nr:alpha/beta hydrolase [Mycobacteriales bacterium]
MTTLDTRAAAGATRAVALVLPGGRADSFEPTAARHLSGVRMRPFAASLQRNGARHGLEVWSVRYRVRGWNGEQASPVADVA